MTPRRLSASRFGLRPLIGAALLVSLVLLARPSVARAQPPSEPKRVLVLYWYDKDYAGNVMFDQSFRSVLKEAPEPIEYYAEYLETNRFPGETQSLLLRDYLRRKYAGRKIDVVVADTDITLEFLLKHRDELFRNTPMVFGAVKRPAATVLSSGPPLTGIISVNTHRETLDLALQLHPDTERVFVISGTFERDKRFEIQAQDELRNYGGKASIDYLTDLPLDELIEKTKSLPKRSIVLYAWQQSLSEDGQLLESRETLRLISASASVPFYGMGSANVGYGIVGGYVSGPGTNGTRMAEIVLRVLSGERPQDIPIASAPSGPMFDWRQMQRWGISEARLPPHSKILFKELTVWEQFRWQIIGVLVLFGVQTSFIVVLLLERKRRRESDATYRSIFNGVNDAIFVHDAESGAVVDVNQVGCELYKVTREEARIAGPDLSSNEPPFTSDAAQARLARAVAGEPQIFEWPARDKTGRLFWVEVSLKRSVIGGKDRVLAVVRDITSGKQADEALRESEQRFRTMAEAAPMMIWVSGPEKKCTYFSQRWLDFTGRTLEHELGDGWVDGVHADDLARCLLTYNSSFDLRRPFTMEYKRRKAGGQYSWVYDCAAPRISSSGEFLGYVGSCLDISERKATEEALIDLSGRLIRAQEDERGRIARELHDDLNQRMALVSVWLDRLRQSPPETLANSQGHLKKIMDQTVEISNEIHRMSYDLHPSWLGNVGLVAAVRALCEEVGPRHGLLVDFIDKDVPETLPEDISLCLYRVVQECLSNIVKHSGARDAQVRLLGSEDEIRLRVSDSGRGFDIESAGTHDGLGLISMRERLRLVGGVVLIDSHSSHGTQIDARVPLLRTDLQRRSSSEISMIKTVRADGEPAQNISSLVDGKSQTSKERNRIHETHTHSTRG